MMSAVNFKVRTLPGLFGQVINKHLRMNASINLELLTEIPGKMCGQNAYTRKKYIFR